MKSIETLVIEILTSFHVGWLCLLDLRVHLLLLCKLANSSSCPSSPCACPSHSSPQSLLCLSVLCPPCWAWTLVDVGMCLIPCHALHSLGPGTRPRGLKGIKKKKDRRMYRKVGIKWTSQGAVIHSLGGEEVATVASLCTHWTWSYKESFATPLEPGLYKELGLPNVPWVQSLEVLAMAVPTSKYTFTWDFTLLGPPLLSTIWLTYPLHWTYTFFFATFAELGWGYTIYQVLCDVCLSKDEGFAATSTSLNTHPQGLGIWRSPGAAAGVWKGKPQRLARLYLVCIKVSKTLI